MSNPVVTTEQLLERRLEELQREIHLIEVRIDPLRREVEKIQSILELLDEPVSTNGIQPIEKTEGKPQVERQRETLRFLSDGKPRSASEISKHLGVTTRAVNNYLKPLIEGGRVTGIGNPKAANRQYRIIPVTGQKQGQIIWP